MICWMRYAVTTLLRCLMSCSVPFLKGNDGNDLGTAAAKYLSNPGILTLDADWSDFKYAFVT